MNSIEPEDNINELLNSTELLQIPNIIQELFHKMNSKIDSLSNKINLLQHNSSDVVTKEHLNTISATKVDITDFLNTVNNIDQHIKQKPSMEELKYLSEEKISKTDLNQILSEYIHKKDFEDFIETTSKTNNFNNIKNNTNNKLDSILIEFNKKINSLPSMNDIDKINNALAKKANLSEIKNILAQKADKNEISEIIKNKVDNNYLDNQLKKKMDIYILDKIQNDLNLKTNLEDIDKIQEELDKKIDTETFNNLVRIINNKLDKNDLGNIIDEIVEKQNEITDTKFKALDIDFDRFIESVKTQFNNINQAVNKLSKDKIDKIYFEERLNTKLDGRKLINELDKQNQENKLKINDINIKNKENIENINSKLEEINLNTNNEIESLKEDIKNIIKELNSLTNNSQYNFDLVIKEKNNFDFYKNETSNKLANLFDKIESKIDTNIFNKNLIKVQEDLKNYINNISQDKITYKEVETIMKNMNEKNDKGIIKNKNDFDNKITNMNNQILSLEKNKITNEQLNKALETKINEINNEINKRAFINDFSNLNNKIRQINETITKKLDEKSFEENQRKIATTLNQIQSDLLNIYTKEEQDNLFNEKLNMNTFNSVVKELNNLIDTKLDIIDYKNYHDIQEMINTIYLNENATGIWKWVSSKLNNGYIPLEIEYYNTMRDNFIWEEDRTSLMIVNKGVYNIKIVVFTNELNINITLVINGENIISKNLDEKNRNVIRPNNKINFRKIEIDEIISINEKVRVSILFSGKNTNAKGFMKISTIHYEQEKDFDIKNAKAVEQRLRLSNNNIIDINNNNHLLIQENLEIEDKKNEAGTGIDLNMNQGYFEKEENKDKDQCLDINYSNKDFELTQNVLFTKENNIIEQTQNILKKGLLPLFLKIDNNEPMFLAIKETSPLRSLLLSYLKKYPKIERLFEEIKLYHKRRLLNIDEQIENLNLQPLDIITNFMTD